MPGGISVSDFLRETREDLSSPTTSNFVTRIPQCKETVNKLEEVSKIRDFKNKNVTLVCFCSQYSKLSIHFHENELNGFQSVCT